MKEILEYLQSLFGSQITVAAVVIVCAYYLVIGASRVINEIRKNFSAASSHSAAKSSLELLKLLYEIEALKKSNDLQELEYEATLRSTDLAPLLDEERTSTGWEYRRQAWEGRLTKFFSNYKVIGYLTMIFSHVVIRGWGVGMIVMLALISTFEGQQGIERTNWINVFILVGLILFGFIIANWILAAARRAGLSDPLRYVSYLAGVVLSVIIFNSPMRP